MNNETTKTMLQVKTLNERLRRLFLSNTWIADDGATLKKGQIWSVAGGCDEGPDWSWLVLDVIDSATVNVVPIFRWGELSGPDDVYVPRDYAGTVLVASFELEHTLNVSALATCLGMMPSLAMDYIFKARRDMENPDKRVGHFWGMDYLDEMDVRLKYHETISKVIEKFQAHIKWE